MISILILLLHYIILLIIQIHPKMKRNSPNTIQGLKHTLHWLGVMLVGQLLRQV